MKPKIYTCEYVCASDIAPKWAIVEDFWAKISEGAPFSWGDNELSLVTASCFADWCEEVLDDSRKVKNWLKQIRELGEMYIDLEN